MYTRKVEVTYSKAGALGRNILGTKEESLGFPSILIGGCP